MKSPQPFVAGLVHLRGAPWKEDGVPGCDGEKPMLYFVGRAMQVLGMLQLGVALYLGVTLEGGMAEEYKWLGIGAAVFLMGRLLERKGASG